MLVAGLVIAGLLSVGEASDDGEDAPPAGTPVPTPEGTIVRLPLTTNLRALPARQADLVAIIPGEETARVTAQSPDGEWLRVVYPVDSRLEGWVPSAGTTAVQGDPAQAPVVDVTVEEPQIDGGTATPEPERLPDLTVTHAFLLPNGNLTIRVANAGRGTFDDRIAVRITSAEGELIGVLEIERTLLQPGRAATVDTNVAVTRTGTYVIEVDWLDEVRESGEFNNVLRQLLVAAGSDE